jgi:hypothetical protein
LLLYICTSHYLFRIFSSRIVSLAHLALHCHKSCVTTKAALVTAADKTNNSQASASARENMQNALETAAKMLQPIDAFLSALAESQDLAVSGNFADLHTQHTLYMTRHSETQAKDFNDLVMNLMRSKLELQSSFRRS